jgi:hypothetical protein
MAFYAIGKGQAAIFWGRVARFSVRFLFNPARTGPIFADLPRFIGKKQQSAKMSLM